MAVYKNKASQKVACFAYDSTDGSAKTGDAANITAQISKDGAATAATDDTNPTELDATDAPGIYLFDLTQSESNADLIVIAPVSATSDILIEPLIIYTEPEQRTADMTAISGDSTAADNLEAACDGTGYNVGGGSVVAASVTGAVGSVPNVTLADGAHGGSSATINLSQLKISGANSGEGSLHIENTQPIGALSPGVYCTAARGDGVFSTSTYAVGAGIHLQGGTTGGAGLQIDAPTPGTDVMYGIVVQSSRYEAVSASVSGTDNHSGFEVSGSGTGHGIHARSGGGATGDGLHAEALSTNGNGINLTPTGTGADINGSVESVTGGINTSAGTITTLDALDTAQDSQHSTTQSAISSIPTNPMLATENGSSFTAIPDMATATNQSTIAGYIDTEVGTIITHLTDIKGGTFSGATDSLEAIRNRGDAEWVTATGFSTHDAAAVVTAMQAAADDFKADVSGLATAAALTTVDTVVDSIKTVTDALPDSGALTSLAQASGVAVTSLSSAAITDVWSTDTLTESYAADGAAGTPAQILYLIQQAMTEFAIDGTTITIKKLNGTTTAATFTLDDGTTPTSRTRAT